jgi:hypothetical protein
MFFSKIKYFENSLLKIWNCQKFVLCLHQQRGKRERGVGGIGKLGLRVKRL